jgi:hypothetical protein
MATQMCARLILALCCAQMREAARADRATTGQVPLHLVSCVSEKLDRDVRAEELYVSPWFRKARAYVNAINAPWRILSAKHGLLRPDAIVGPYEATLNTMAIAPRRAWAERVLRDLEPLVAAGDTVVVIAGARYREFLVPTLARWSVRVDIPLEGLRIGEQLRWFAISPAGHLRGGDADVTLTAGHGDV